MSKYLYVARPFTTLTVVSSKSFTEVDDAVKAAIADVDGGDFIIVEEIKWVAREY